MDLALHENKSILEIRAESHADAERLTAFLDRHYVDRVCNVHRQGGKVVALFFPLGAVNEDLPWP